MAATQRDDELKRQLRARFVGKKLNEVPTPSVVLDLAKLRVNCERMLDATERLGLLWRAHIKSHKTTELTRLQVGDERTTPVSLIVSTILEAENILPLLKAYQAKGRSVLFSFPLFPSAVSRLAAIASSLGPQSLSLMIDNISQLSCVAAISATVPSSHLPLIFLKIDTGYGRAGVVPSSAACEALIDAALAEEAKGTCVLHGLYSHAGHSYGARDDLDAMYYLVDEFAGLARVARRVRAKSPDHELVLSVGATPTTTAVQYPCLFSAGGDAKERVGMAREVEMIVAELKGGGYRLEVHAGVYPTLDLQQLATHARDSSLMTADDIAISVVAEVASVYPGRGGNRTTEALINAGTLALGREPVADRGEDPDQDYSGWGILMPWGLDNPKPGPDFPRVHGGWQVGRISQEHGILVWKGRKEEEVPLHFGQRVRVWPNHSCIAGACFDYYLIIDSSGPKDEVIDVWPRWRGW